MKKSIKLLYCVLIFSCTNDLEQKETLPTGDLVSYYNAAPKTDVFITKRSYFSPRNRIHLKIDSSMNFFLNGDLISSASLEEDFEFIYLNPEKLSHLPESPEKTVVFISNDLTMILYKGIKNPETDKTKLLSLAKKEQEAARTWLRMLKVVDEIQETYALNHFGKPLEDLSTSQTRELLQKFPFNKAHG